ncbi:glycoside hydrolase family 17 protein, partial [Karstenula rhodostoma CBS 690.94]
TPAPLPSTSEKPVVPAPVPSTSEKPVVPAPVPSTSEKPVVPAPAPETSTSCTEEEHPSSAAYKPAPLPSTSEKPVVPAPTSTSCTEEEHPSSAAYTPAPLPSTSEKPVVPAPVPSTSEKPVVPSSAYVPAAPSSPAASIPVAPSSPAASVPVAPSSPAASVPVAPSSSPAPYIPAKPSSSHVAPPAKPSSYHAAPPASTSQAAPKPKPSAPSYGTGSWNKPNGKKWAITYTPYTKGGDCKPELEVQTDIAKIADLGYVAIRVYSTDCGVFENVIPATLKYGIQVIYGIFLDAATAPGSDGANEQLQDIIDNAPKDTASMLIVGNEYISGHGGDAGSLASYVAAVKTKWVAAGFTAPVTTTETVAAWEQYGSALCDVIDIFAAQVQPYFDGGKTASEAGDFAISQLEQAAKICPEAAAKGKFISEIGWPAGGSPNGAAVPGKAEQKEAMQSIIEKVGDHACIFSYQNDNWKNPGAYNVEQYFGCADNL